MQKRNYGYVKDEADERDYRFKLSAPVALPKSVDLRGWITPAYNQTTLGSCTANAIAGSLAYLQTKNNTMKFDPSRLFIYYNERMVEGTINEDAGAQLRNGIKVMASYGVCDEKIWPYDVSKFKIRPTNECYTSATNYEIKSYERVNQTLQDLKSCLASGYPFVFGFMVYDSFESQEVAESGFMPVPDKTTENFLGGHAVCAVGYDDKYGFLIRNSWGPKWGIEGHFWMPYKFIVDQNNASDFWTIKI